MKIADLFDAAAGDYDAARLRLVPCFKPFYAAAADALPFDGDRELRILDLGAGTGLLSALCAVRYPRASFVLVDVAEAMLRKAEERFADRPGSFTTFEMDYREQLPAGPFEAVVSALSIHHLSDQEKRTLFRRIHEALAPGGMFVNAEHVQGETREQEREWDAWWERRARALGSNDDEIAAARERMTQDRCSTLTEQLRWLGEAGFVDVFSPFQEKRFAVYAGCKQL